MLDVDINKFIDFASLFYALYHENEDMMNEVVADVGDTTYKDILAFKQSKLLSCIDIDECELDDSNIVFVFSQSDDNANESDTQGSGFVCTINYDRTLENFDNFTSDNY